MDWPRPSRKVPRGLTRTLTALVPLAALAGCSEPGPSEIEGLKNLPPDFAISDTIGITTTTLAALRATDQNLTYVSASPGSFPDGVSVTVTNLANGSWESAFLRDGGFDPVALPAEAGDELEIVVQFSDGTSSKARKKVPPRRRPRVVRTRPPKGETDVVVNAKIMFVFSEPMDGSSVTAETVQLRLDGVAVEGTLTLSDDGLRVEFEPAAPLQLGRDYTLVITQGVLDLDGDPLEEEVRTNFTTAFARDIIFLSDRGGSWDIYGVNADGRGLVNLSRESGSDWRLWSPEWSPDGTKIAFASRRDGNLELYVMNADGSGQVRLTDSPLHETIPVWSPDGSRIVFVAKLEDNTVARDVDIYVMDADGTNRVKVSAPGDAWAPAWSPDGLKIAFVSFPDPSERCCTDIYTINADGVTDLVNVTNTPPRGSEEVPSWSPDGSKITFVYMGDIFSINPDGTERVNLTNSSDSDEYQVAWSPDGLKIAYTSVRDGKSDIFLMEPDGTGQLNLTSSPGTDEGGISWSPNDRRIVFTSGAAGGRELYVMYAGGVGAGQVRLTNSPADDFLPLWRPQR